MSKDQMVTGLCISGKNLNKKPDSIETKSTSKISKDEPDDFLPAPRSRPGSASTAVKR